MSELTGQIGSIGTLSKNSINPAAPVEKTNQSQSGGASFGSMLQKAIGDLNEAQVQADKAVADLATGEITDLHQAAIAIGKAEMSMKLMLEIRNKAISAYKEVARTQL